MTIHAGPFRPPPAGGSLRPTVAAGLPIVLLWIAALGLRLWGIGFAAGFSRARPDEDAFLVNALRMFDGNLDPGFRAIGFPEGLFLVQHAILAVQEHVYAWLHGTEVNLGCVWALHPGDVAIPVRVFSALAGTATLAPVAMMATRLAAPAEARTASLAATAMMAFDYLHGRDSHFAVSDAPLALFCAWSVWGMIRLAETGSLRHALAAGGFAGLASAFKWHGLFLGPVLAVVVAAVVVRPSRRGARDRLLVGLTPWLAAVAGFGLLSPFALLAPSEALAGLLAQRERYTGWGAGLLSPDPSADQGFGLVFHTTVTLPVAMGWVGLLLAVLGLAAALRRGSPAGRVGALAVLSLYVAAVGPSRVLFVRYAIPVLPVLVAFAGAGFAAATTLARRAAPPVLPRRTLVPLMLLAAVAAPALRLVEVDRILARPDTRELAQAWLVEHTGPGDTTTSQGYFASTQALEAGLLQACNARLPESFRRLVPVRPDTRNDWAAVVDRGKQGWGAIAIAAAFGSPRRPPPPGAEPAYVTRGVAVLACGRRWRGDLGEPAPFDPGCLEPVARFGPGAPGCEAIFDVFDAFYLPFDGLAGVERMGPEMTLYRNRCRAASTR
jgi:hypothetical protein